MGNRKKISRRGVLRLSLGATMASSAISRAEESSKAKRPEEPKVTAKENGMSYGTIGDFKISRLILGSNPPGVHSRDLIYVSALGRAYNTKARMLDTYALAESQGINTVMQGNTSLIREYNTTRGGHLRTIQSVHVSKDDDKGKIKNILTEAMKVNDVAAAFYIMGDRGDYLARAKRIDVVGTAMDVAQELGITLGLGGHSLQVVTECEKSGISPDF